MEKTISRIGNSAGITLDKALPELAHKKIGDKENVTVSNGSLTITASSYGVEDDELRKSIARMRRKFDGAMKKLAK